MIFVDGVAVGEPDEFTIRDRRKLSDDGIFIVVATISADDGSQVADPEVIFRGVAMGDDKAEDDLADGIADVVDKTLEEAAADKVGDDRPDPGGPPRRHRGVRLEEAEAPAAGPAGRRRGLEPATRREGRAAGRCLVLHLKLRALSESG